MSRVLAGRKGGTNGGIKRRQMSVAIITARLENLTPLEAFLLGRKYGKADSGNRAKTAKQEGFSDGYEAGYDAAIRERRQSA